MRAPLIVLTAALLGCQEFTIGRGNRDQGVDLVYEPDISVSPAALGFGQVVPGCEPLSADVTALNTGAGELTVTEFQLDGPDAAAFQLVGEPGAVAPGGGRAVTVTFTADATRAYEASLRVFSDDPDEPVLVVPITGEGAAAPEIEQVFEQTGATAVDLLFVVDDSASMRSEVQRLTTVFDAFIEDLEQLALDYQIGVTTTDTTDPSTAGLLHAPILTPDHPNPTAAFAAALDVGTDGAGAERGLDAVHTALSPERLQGANAGLLREQAQLAVVVLSDEDDGSLINGASFVRWFDGLKADPAWSSVSGLVGPDSASYAPTTACDLPNGTRATTAPRYHDAITATGGAASNLCDGDAEGLLDLLSRAASGLRTRFPLDEAPVDPSAIQVEVDGVSVAEGGATGWTWHGPSNSVNLEGAARAAAGETVRIRYAYAATCSP
jgi:hypothetical protein